MLLSALKNIKLLKNEIPRYLILSIWLIINFVAFIVIFFSYHNSLEYFYLRKIVKDGISWSRASAFCINLNSAALLLLVCRNFISYTRSIFHCSTNLVRIIDKHVSLHRYTGYLIIFFSIIHTLGHVMNMENFVIARNLKDKPGENGSDRDESGLLSTLSLLNTRPNGTYLNPVQTENAIPIIESLKLLAGITGILLCLALSVIASTSSKYIRRSSYNIFWYSHQIFALLFFILFCIHGLQGVVRKQTNINRHNPQQCYLVYSKWPINEPERVCDIPQFTGSMASSWIWVLAPIIVYLIERLVRFIRGLKRYKVKNFIKHPSNVLELQIERSLKYKAGQYVYLNLNKISFFEWHPFTITSAPDDDYLSVHIRCIGDWTNDLLKYLNDNHRIDHPVKLSIDGPFGSCAEDVFKYEKVVLIGAGIGVTPYASILKHIWHIISGKNSNSTLLKKVYFFWICPTIDAFEWFGKLLQDLEKEMNNKNINLLEYKIYLTRGWSLKDAKQIAKNDSETYDIFTGLQQKTNYGRPNFELFFKDLSQSDEFSNSFKQRCGVFFCGPPQLSKELHIICNKYSNEAISFIYNKESF